MDATSVDADGIVEGWRNATKMAHLAESIIRPFRGRRPAVGGDAVGGPRHGLQLLRPEKPESPIPLREKPDEKAKVVALSRPAAT